MSTYLKLIAGIFSILLLEAGEARSQQILIEGTVQHWEPEQLYLFTFDNLNWQKLDSAKLEGRHFRFDCEIPSRGWYRIGPSIDKSFEVILGEPKIVLKVDYSSSNISSSWSPPEIEFMRSPENEGLGVYRQFLSDAREKLNGLDSISRSMRQLHGSELEKATELLTTRMNQLESFKNQNYLELAARYPDLFVGKLAKFYAVRPGVPVEHYFSAEDFVDPELASPLYYQGKLITYLQLHQIQHLTQLSELIDNLIALTPQASPGREALFITLVDFLKTGAPDYASSLVRRYQMEFPQSLIAGQLAASLPKPGPQIGETAPDITLSDQQGQPLLLSSLRGKYVLLDFWASWCGPCRKEAPSVVAAYKRFKDLGFTIYSVSLDSNRDRWLQAIENDGLDWHHVSDLAGWKSQAAEAYQVRSIPATYLIDPEGKIVAKDLRGPVLTQVLRQRLEISQDDQ